MFINLRNLGWNLLYYFKKEVLLAHVLNFKKYLVRISFDKTWKIATEMSFLFWRKLWTNEEEGAL